MLFDFIEEAHHRGEQLLEALLDAGIVRLRPVMITVGLHRSASAVKRRLIAAVRRVVGAIDAMEKPVGPVWFPTQSQSDSRPVYPRCTRNPTFSAFKASNGHCLAYRYGEPFIPLRPFGLRANAVRAGRAGSNTRRLA